MIVKMKFLSITGPKNDIDRMTQKYLSKYEIHLVNALSELKTKENLTPYIEINPYLTLLKNAKECTDQMENSEELPQEQTDISTEEATSTISHLHARFATLRAEKQALEQAREKLQNSLQLVSPFRLLNVDIPTVLQYKYIKFRFGKISLDYYRKFYEYAYDNLETIFLEGGRDDEYVWGVYFAASSEVDAIDAVFTSLHFERIYLPNEYDSTPRAACEKLEKQIEEVNNKISLKEKEISNLFASQREKFLISVEKIENLSKQYDIRKLAACTDEKHEQFYILCGWMSAEDTADFIKDIETDDKIFAIIEDHKDHVFSKPPTKLKNFKLFKPFEMFVKMYGLPSYEEKDPTAFIAITYSFIFGVMFGDVGQGLVLAVGGFLLYKLKHMQLAAIISLAGVFSTVFGFMFGSVFGFEDIIHPIWMRPINTMTDLPFIGKLNTIFVYAIAFGMCVILYSMVLHMINAKKQGDLGSMYFDPNGLAGLVFYGSAVAAVVLFMTGNTVPGGIVLFVMFGIPLILIALKEPITHKLMKIKSKEKTSVGMFIAEAFFELFEMLLSYFSNTLSFVRIGAFAVSHAAMMEVVLLLAGAESGAPNWAVIIGGNIFVTGFEGLIVGIQVLRLEYYEMFSRFYKGGGKEFKPYAKVKKVKAK